MALKARRILKCGDLLPQKTSALIFSRSYFRGRTAGYALHPHRPSWFWGGSSWQFIWSYRAAYKTTEEILRTALPYTHFSEYVCMCVRTCEVVAHTLKNSGIIIGEEGCWWWKKRGTTHSLAAQRRCRPLQTPREPLRRQRLQQAAHC